MRPYQRVEEAVRTSHRLRKRCLRCCSASTCLRELESLSLSVSQIQRCSPFPFVSLHTHWSEQGKWVRIEDSGFQNKIIIRTTLAQWFQWLLLFGVGLFKFNFKCSNLPRCSSSELSFEIESCEWNPAPFLADFFFFIL